MNRTLKIVSIALAVMVVLGASGAGAALANEPTATPTSPADYQQALLAKVAAKLGIDQQKVTDAFKQAAKELENEMIDKAVADGRIGQDMANWLKQRPDDGRLGMGFGIRGFPGGKWFRGPAPSAQATPSSSQ